MPEATAETATPDAATTETTETETTEPSVDSLQAELDKWKTQSRRNEERAKANATAAAELAALKQSSMTDQEKAVEAARQSARTEVLTSVAGRLVDAEVKTAAAGRSVDVDALLEGLDRSRFLTTEGEPDIEAIKAWVDRIAPEQQTRSFPDLGQGARSQALPLNGDPLERALKDKLGIR